MKTKTIILFLSIVCVGQLNAMIPSLPDARRDLWVQATLRVREWIRKELPQAKQQEKREQALGGKGEDLVKDISDQISAEQANAKRVLEAAQRHGDKWAANPEKELPWGERIRTIFGAPTTPPSPPAAPAVPERDPHVQPIPGGAARTPTPGPEPFFTSARKKLALGAAAVVALGVLYKKAPQWMKNRVKRILEEHNRKLSDLTPVEKDLFIAASYARFNPAGSFFFQEAVLDMPEDAQLRDELWPILNHIYYGKKRVSRKQARELRRLYDEAQELMVVD